MLAPVAQLFLFSSPPTLRSWGIGNLETHSIGDTIGESNEFDLVIGSLPVRIQGQDQPQR